jgi:hypothetical protein
MAQLTPEEIEAARKSYAGTTGARAAKTLREAAGSASAWLAERKPSVSFSERLGKAKDYVKPKVIPGLGAAFAGLESYQNIDRNKAFYADDKVGLWDKAKQAARDVGEPVLQGGLTAGGTIVGAGLGGVMAPVGFGAGALAAVASDKLIDDDGKALAQWKQSQPKTATKAAAPTRTAPEAKGYDPVLIESLKTKDGKPRNYTPEETRQIKAYIADVEAKEALQQQRAAEEAQKIEQREALERLAGRGDKWAERRIKQLDKEAEARMKKTDENMKFSEQKAYTELYHKGNEQMFLNGLDERARGKQAEIFADLASGKLSKSEADESQAALEAVKRSQDWLHGTSRLVDQKQQAVDNTQWDRAGLGVLAGGLTAAGIAAWQAKKGNLKPLSTLLYGGGGGLAGGAGGYFYGGGSQGITEDTDLYAIEQMKLGDDGLSDKEMHIPQGLITPQYGVDLRRRPPP